MRTTPRTGETAWSAGAGPMPPVRGDVVFENVGFSYVPGVPVLEDINLHVTPGQTVALVGESGSGKTTLLNLLAAIEASGGRTLSVTRIALNRGAPAGPGSAGWRRR